MYSIKDDIRQELEEIREAGFEKQERPISAAQADVITTLDQEGGRSSVLNFCSNNYLGLANHPEIISAAKAAMDARGFGMASVRFICGTQDLHLELERRISRFLATEEAILYSSCFDANAGVFEVLFGSQDAIISDELNHASIIDGIRLSKAKRYRYGNRNMTELEECLKEAVAHGARRIVIVTDGVFSMDGYLAPVKTICDLAEQYSALVMVDDSHAVGFMGPSGAGTPELAGVSEKVDIYTGTFGKALGGASGGYVSGRSEIIQLLRQRSRPYLFSNSLAPAIVAATIKSFDLLETFDDLRSQLKKNTQYFRGKMHIAGFNLLPGEHPIVPVMFTEERLANLMVAELLRRGVYVTAFAYPVVPAGKSRIRVQLSAAHTFEQIDTCVEAFIASRDTVEGLCGYSENLESKRIRSNT